MLTFWTLSIIIFLNLRENVGLNNLQKVNYQRSTITTNCERFSDLSDNVSATVIVCTAVVMNVAIFWDVSPCNPFTCWLHSTTPQKMATFKIYSSYANACLIQKLHYFYRCKITGSCVQMIHLLTKRIRSVLTGSTLTVKLQHCTTAITLTCTALVSMCMGGYLVAAQHNYVGLNPKC
jgi:hypothetical protein